MEWLEIALDLEPAAIEPVSALFEKAGCTGIAVTGLPPSQPDLEWLSHPVSSACVTVLGYLPEQEDVEEAMQQIECGCRELEQIGFTLFPPIRTRPVGEEDWAAEWKTHYEPLKVGRRLWICPTWRETPAAANELTLRLDPGMAFGTGLHPTTQLCLELIEERLAPGSRLLDWGCGSGILSAAALLLGARTALLLDIDSHAVSVAAANLALNGLAEMAETRTGSIEELTVEPGRFDFIVANIVAGPIIRAAGCFPLLLKPGGTVVVSGIVDYRLDEVLASLQKAGLTQIERRDRGEWRALVYRAA